MKSSSCSAWTPPGEAGPASALCMSDIMIPKEISITPAASGPGLTRRSWGRSGRAWIVMTSAAPERLLVSGDPIDRSVTWVRPEIVIEVQFTDWSGSGRLRHPVYLGIREDKAARDVVQSVADPEAERLPFKPGRGTVDR